MNVILDNVIFSLQQSGGISVYWYHLAKQLLAQENVNVSYLNEGDCVNIFHDKISFENANFIKTKHYPYIGRYLNLNLKANNEKSIFHSSYYRVSKNPKHANITTVHDFTYEHFKSGIRLKVHNYQKKHAILKSDGIICISENTKRDLLKYIPKAAGKNIKVIPNGVDRIFTKLPKENFEGADIPFSIYSYNLYVGDRSSGYKNFKTAVSASKLAERPLAIVGGGKLTEQETFLLDAELKNFGYQHFNNITTEYLNTLYNFAFCLLYPSIYEGFGIPPLEAQKTGCPVVAFKASSIPEVVGDSGILVEENNAEAFAKALKSLEDEGVREEIIAKGYKNVAGYSWEETYRKTIAFYQEIQNEKNKTA